MSRSNGTGPLPRGVFTLSIDTELAWGGFDRPDREARWALEEQSRVAIRRLLELFAEYQISAAWAVVGHLFLERCERVEGCAHPEITRPRCERFRDDWYRFDPGTDVERDPLWYGPDIIQQLLDAQPVQEIACHSFSHLDFGDAGCSKAAAAADLEACVEAARRWGIVLRSFVYPRNRVGHPGLLAPLGFQCYRGPDPTGYSRWPRLVRRAAHYLEDLLALPPPTVQPSWEGDLWKIPGSMLLQGMDGPRGLIPARCRTRRCLAGLQRAVERHEVFHLWFHPCNFSVRLEKMLACLEPVLEAAAGYRDRGELEVLPMGLLAQRLATGRCGGDCSELPYAGVFSSPRASTGGAAHQDDSLRR